MFIQVLLRRGAWYVESECERAVCGRCRPPRDYLRAVRYFVRTSGLCIVWRATTRHQHRGRVSRRDHRHLCAVHLAPGRPRAHHLHVCSTDPWYHVIPCARRQRRPTVHTTDVWWTSMWTRSSEGLWWNHTRRTASATGERLALVCPGFSVPLAPILALRRGVVDGRACARVWANTST